MQNETQFLDAIKSNQGIIRKLVSLYASSKEDKKDLYQEILLQAWKAYPRFRGDSKFSTWLYSVSLNTILSSNRKRRPEALSDFSAVEIIDNEIDYSDLENKQALTVAILSLSDTDKALISLHFDGYTNQEIADILGISLNNTGVKLHRIKQALAKKIKAYDKA